MEQYRESTSSLSNRPVSRRGLRSNAQSASMEETSPLAPLRPGTGMSVVSNRPTSSMRLGTASRLVSAALARPPTSSNNRIGTALGAMGNMMMDRPITQHGLSGLQTSQGRIGTAAGGMRMVKDKRYWLAVLQSKIDEINEESTKLIKEKSNMDREQSAKRLYDRKVKEAAKELTDLQAKLTDMNIALDSYSSGTTRQSLQKEAAALRERNEQGQSQLEQLFGDKQLSEERNKQLEREIEIEKNKISDMILSLPPHEQARYAELQSLADVLRNQNSEIQNKIEELTSKRERLNTVVMSSQIRLEAVRLHSKLDEMTAKYNSLKEEEDNKLTPEQERDKLLREVRANNQSLTSISHQMKIVQDQLNEKKEQLQLVEQDLEEGNSERHAKYKELKRRDETMTSFLETFQQQMDNEKKNLDKLKNHITYAIEQITLQGINLKSFNITDVLKENNDLTSQGGLLKEYKHLGIQLKQLQILEKRTTTQLKQLMEEEADLINEIRNYSNLDALREEAAEHMEELTSKLDELKKKKRITEDVVEEAKKKNQEIKDHLRSNEAYKQIAHLEDKLVDLLRENKTLQQIIEQNQNDNNYNQIKEEVLNLINTTNNLLLEEKSTKFVNKF